MGPYAGPLTKHKTIRCFEENVKREDDKNFEIEQHRQDEDEKETIIRTRRNTNCEVNTRITDDDKTKPDTNYKHNNTPDKTTGGDFGNHHPEREPEIHIEKTFNVPDYEPPKHEVGFHPTNNPYPETKENGADFDNDRNNHQPPYSGHPKHGHNEGDFISIHNIDNLDRSNDTQSVEEDGDKGSKGGDVRPVLEPEIEDRAGGVGEEQGYEHEKKHGYSSDSSKHESFNHREYSEEKTRRLPSSKSSNWRHSYGSTSGNPRHSYGSSGGNYRPRGGGGGTSGNSPYGYETSANDVDYDWRTNKISRGSKTKSDAKPMLLLLLLEVLFVYYN